MNKNYLPGVIATLVVVFGLVAFLLPTKTIDAITGTWYAEGIIEEDNYEWFVQYTFKNGEYTMKTDSDVKDKGRYELIKFFEDGSITVRKHSSDFDKTYEINVVKFDEDTLIMEGMELKRVQ